MGRPREGRRSIVVDHEMLGALAPNNWGTSIIRWRLKLDCGHFVERAQGFMCEPKAYGAQLIHGVHYLGVPKWLYCRESHEDVVLGEK